MRTRVLMRDSVTNQTLPKRMLNRVILRRTQIPNDSDLQLRRRRRSDATRFNRTTRMKCTPGSGSEYGRANDKYFIYSAVRVPIVYRIEMIMIVKYCFNLG